MDSPRSFRLGDSDNVSNIDNRSSNNSIWTVPATVNHDPVSSDGHYASQQPISSSAEQVNQPPRRSYQFIDRLSGLMRKGPPPPLPKRHLGSENSGFAFDSTHQNPVYVPDSNSSNTDSNRNSGSVRTSQIERQGSTDILEALDENADDNENLENSLPVKKSAQDGIHTNDENTVRGNWGSHIEFVLSCVGYAVGLGNVWRFPYLCYKNGGGSFLVIYWILSATVGLPIIFLELSLGQFTSQGPTGVWNYAPIVKGLGYSMCSISAIAAIYYNVIISWSLYYLFASFRSQLLWSECDFNSWADYRCELAKVGCMASDQLRGNDGLCYSKEGIERQHLTSITTMCKQSNSTFDMSSVGRMVPCSYIVGNIVRNRDIVVGCWDETLAIKEHRGPLFSTEQYFYRSVLGQDGKVDEDFSAVSLGQPQTWLVLCLLLAWILVYLCLLNGIKSSGKVVYFTALFPYVVLAILIGKGVTLEGASDGIMYFITPHFERMKEPAVWYAAASQLFFSLAACWGGMMALSSYNKFHTNTLRDALIVTAADTFTSFFASLAIFSVIGYGSHVLNKPVEEVADASTGLAFILYPKIIDTLPGSVAWAIMFFIMLLVLGLDSEFNSLETIFTALLDKYPSLRSSLKKKAGAFAIFCLPFFLLGIPLVCPGGMQLLELVDNYGAGWGVFFIGIVEVLSVAWIYGTDRFSKDLSAMMPWLLNGARRAKVVPWIMRCYWGIITPAMLLFVMFFSWTQYKSRENVREEILGWCVTIFVMMWIPIMAIWVVIQQCRRQGSFWQGLRSAVSPSSRWGPYLEEHRAEVAAIHGKVLARVATDVTNIDSVSHEGPDKPKSNVIAVNRPDSFGSIQSFSNPAVFFPEADNHGVIDTTLARGSNDVQPQTNVIGRTRQQPEMATIGSPNPSPSFIRPTNFNDEPYVIRASKRGNTSRTTQL